MSRHLLINLPTGFFRASDLRPVWRRLGRLAALRKRSHDTAQQIAGDLAWAEAVIMWSWPVLDQTLLAGAPRLKFAGHINLSRQGAEAELERGIVVSEARHGWSPAVAEMAITLILTSLRKVSTHHRLMRAGRESWVRSFPDDIDPLEYSLYGKSVGIVGFGGVGQNLARLLAPFGVSLCVYDPYLPVRVARAHGARLLKLGELVKRADIIVLCAANTGESRHLIGAAQIRAMRRHALLVNVGRASLVDMKALETRLRRGDLFAALDVFEQEPLQRRHPLRRLDNVWLTPHRAGGIIFSVRRILDMLADDYERFLRGDEARHAVTDKTLHCLPDAGSA